MSKAIPSRLIGSFLQSSRIGPLPNRTILDHVSFQIRPTHGPAPSISSQCRFISSKIHQDRQTWRPTAAAWRQPGGAMRLLGSIEPVSPGSLLRPAIWRPTAANNYSRITKPRGRPYSNSSDRPPARTEPEPVKRPRQATDNDKRTADGSVSHEPGHGPTKGQTEGEAHAPESLASSMSKYLPRMPHRPTKEELLDAATNFRQRMKVRFKWMSIRSMRPWNADEWGAFVSWVMLGHLVWVLVGTTTFFSLVILSINTVFAQGMLHITLHAWLS